MTTFDPHDDADALFDSKYLRWFHLEGKPQLVEITKVERGVSMTLPGGATATKPVLTLKLIQGTLADVKPLVLNVTNRNAVKAILGRRTSEWIGGQIVLEQGTAQLRGETVPCVAIRKPTRKAK